jgi:hypothetical protein
MSHKKCEQVIVMLRDQNLEMENTPWVLKKNVILNYVPDKHLSG